MANLTTAEHKMLGKYYGIAGLQDNEEFWQDVLIVYKEAAVPLPLELNVSTFRQVSGMLDCPPEKCAECCRYNVTQLKAFDVKRLLKAPGITKEYLESVCCQNEGGIAINSQAKGCPFLKNNACSIYEFRPDICYTFPLQQGIRSNTQDGKVVEQIHIRVKCLPAVNLVRQVITEVLAHNKQLILLPDLNVILKGETNGKG